MVNKYNIKYIAGSVLFVLLVWGYQQLPFKEEVIDLGFGEKAQQNPFLASELFLQELGNKVTMVKSLNKLDDLPEPMNSSIVLATKNRALSSTQIDTLLSWIEQGGHLITNANSFTNLEDGSNKDLLLAYLGIEVYPIDEEDELEQTPKWIQQMLMNQPDACSASDRLMTLSDADGNTVEISMNSNATLYHIDELETYSAANQFGTQLIQLEMDKGSVTLLTDLAIWSNNQVHCFDHAYFLKYLVGDDDIMIFYHIHRASIFSLMWHQAPLFVILSLLLIFFWIWHKSQRFGPLVTFENTKRRSLLEHINASAVFAWRNGEINTMIGPLREAIRSHMTIHHPGFKNMIPDEQYALIAKITHLEPEQIRWAFDKSEVQKPIELEKLIQQLQTIKDRI